MPLLAIDPGPEYSAYVALSPGGTVLAKGILCNEAQDAQGGQSMLEIAREYANCAYLAVIELPVARGQRVGNEVFTTCRWVGRFEQAWNEYCWPQHTMRTATRQEVVLYFCGANLRGADGAVRQVLIDRYGPGKDKAVGKKKTPGPLYGITADMWQALALGCYVVDTMGKYDGKEGRILCTR